MPWFPVRWARTLGSSTPDWVDPAFRLVVAALVAGPALSKFVTYGNSVAFFAAYGLPYPEATVLVAGLVEVVAVASLLLDVEARLAAMSLVPVMLVAITYVGLDWKNLAVLFGSLAILVTSTGSSPGRVADRAAAVVDRLTRRR